MSKSLLPVGGKPIIDRIIDKVTAAGGVSVIYIVTNAKFFESFGDWLKSSRHKKIIALINDGTTDNENRLGAVKDMELAISRKAVSDDLLVVAGDNLFGFDMAEFIKFAKGHIDGVSVALYDIADREAAGRFGVVAVDDRCRVTDFEEKPARPKSTLISTGIYYFPKNKVGFIKEYVRMRTCPDAPGHYIGWLSKRDKVYGFKFIEDWFDIGNIESYEKADKKYSNK